MNRRGFLKSIVGGVATAAAVRTWPFRVYSFPKEIAVPDRTLILMPTDCRTIRGIVDPHTFALLQAQRRFLPAGIDYDIRVVKFDHEEYIRRTAAKLEKIQAI